LGTGQIDNVVKSQTFIGQPPDEKVSKMKRIKTSTKKSNPSVQKILRST
jgi:hypothetical protein